MGDPKRIRSKYDTPVHPWQKERLEEEKSLVQIYGLVNKREVYKAGSKLKKYKDIAKSLVSKSQSQAEKERQELFRKLKSLNLVTEDSIDAVLGLQLEQLMERRLQTIVFKKGYARTVKQARQMITHRHITVDGKMITSPSYLVTTAEESKIGYYGGSAFVDEEHPERKPKETAKDKVEPKPKADSKTETAKKEEAVKKTEPEEKAVEAEVKEPAKEEAKGEKTENALEAEAKEETKEPVQEKVAEAEVKEEAEKEPEKEEVAKEEVNAEEKKEDPKPAEEVKEK